MKIIRAGQLAAGAVLVVGIGSLFLVVAADSSITVTQGDFTLTCPSNTVAEGATLSCTLTNGSAEAKPWPVVAILHLSTDDDRALVRGSSIDVTLSAPSPKATIDGGVTWIGDTLVGYSRFDWSGNAGADPAQTTTSSGASTTVGGPGNSRTVTISAGQDTLDEDSETFYVALGPDGSQGVGLLYNNKESVTLTDDDSPSTDKSLSSLKLSAGQDFTLSATAASQSQTVGYGVTEATLTAVAAGGATMTMSASFDNTGLDLDGRGGTSVDVLSGRESAAVPLAVGTTTVTLTVTAADGTTTGTHTVSVVRSELGDATTVSVSAGGFTLTCPAEVAKATVAECTLRASRSGRWPVVAIIHSSADGASRALVAEDPIIPDTDPSYSRDLSLGKQQPARTAFNFGYGELFSGGSRSLYRTYGYEKFDWTGNASAGATRKVTIQLHDNAANSGRTAEVFYVALAPSDYTGFSKLVDNMVPILLKELPATRSVAAQNLKSTAAEVVVEARNPGGKLYLRYRAQASGPWTKTETEQAVTSSPVQFSLSGLWAETQYQVQASFDEDFGTGVRSGSFTTLVAPTVSSMTAGGITKTTATVTVTVANPEGSALHLRYQADGDATWTTTSKAASSSTVTFSLSSLTAGTDYDLEASFDSGFSGKTTASFTTTPEPSVLAASPGSITETTATVTVTVANSDGSSVSLRHQADGSTTWTTTSKTVSSSSSSVQFDLSGLTASTTYDLEASFDSSFSAGVASATFTTTTPAASVSSVSAGSITKTSATVSLEVAHPAGATVYLRYRAGSSGSWTTKSKAASASPVTFALTGLTAGTKYELEASFSSDFSAGVASATFTTKPPPSVSSLEAGDISHSSATLTLTVANLDEDATVYVRYRAGSSGSWTTRSKQASSSSTAVEFELGDLVARTEYQMRASFSSNFSTGVASGVFTTLPPSVSSVATGNITHSSATVTAEVDGADGRPLHLRHREYPSSGAWEETSRPARSTTAFLITGLTPDTEYDVEVSPDSSFDGAETGYFRTLDAPPPPPPPPPRSAPSGPGPPGGGGNLPPEPEPEPEPTRFSDVAKSDTHAASIEALYAAGITGGCSQQPLRFCPNQPVTRAQMATFLTRALNLDAPAASAGLSDVAASDTHAASIEALYAAGITGGCSQQPLRFCPNQPVTRAQMATFLTRALDLEAPGTKAGFSDVAESDTHAASIEALYAAGITLGCSLQPLQFCPDQPVTRAEMATFLTRALDRTAQEAQP